MIQTQEQSFPTSCKKRMSQNSAIRDYAVRLKATQEDSPMKVRTIAECNCGHGNCNNGMVQSVLLTTAAMKRIEEQELNCSPVWGSWRKNLKSLYCQAATRILHQDVENGVDGGESYFKEILEPEDLNGLNHILNGGRDGVQDLDENDGTKRNTELSIVNKYSTPIFG